MRELITPYRIADGRAFRLRDHDPQDTGAFTSKSDAAEPLERGLESLREMHEQLYAEGTWALLVIIQAMDAAGKDSTIKHVMTGLNPQGCRVSSFKAPSTEELSHDFLWRTTLRLPERGQIGVFNRSYYEEVLVVRVHPEMLTVERLPPPTITRTIWRERFEDIVCYERHLQRNGVAVVKFFLNVSKDEQRRRFLERLDTPSKNWKFSAGDVRERECWDDYMAAYEDMIRHTATRHAPWFVVPADHKWFTRLVVAEAIIDAMKRLDLHFPILDRAKKKTLKAMERALRHTDA